ncbi:hypothetical protein [Comamonas odontotermitis]|uniref:hypothetical protein n=1 Tax=Comamonas odontotermitis TaxID=379895 RepID=UPI001CC5673F|nr:hypothetical protein [Comamonas odontotermitis]UBB15460.1 hypothetical protein LAD35_11295 [Comamonas odontotermitis]
MQHEIPETLPTSCGVPHKRAQKVLLDTGGHAALAAAQLELEEIRKQHPGIAGLTLAIAVVARHAAEKQMNSSREVLIQAAHAGLPIENHAIALEFTNEGLRLKAYDGQTG